MQQNIYHKNVPNGDYKRTASNSLVLLNTSGVVTVIANNYVMGWWHLTTDKVKNGLHIIKTDSIYIPYEGNEINDTIPW